jgi:hypothetical protein
MVRRYEPARISTLSPSFSASRRSMSDIYSTSAVAAISRGTWASRMSSSPSHSTGPSLSRTKNPDLSEDFLTQELPVPLLGFRIDRPLLDRLSLVGSLTGGYLPRVDSLRYEGGEVRLSQTHADASAGPRYRLTPGIAAVEVIVAACQPFGLIEVAGRRRSRRSVHPSRAAARRSST